MDLINGRGNAAGAATAQVPNAANLNTRPKLPPKMCLEEFCYRYELSEAIQHKLADYEVSGPHAICYLKADKPKDGCGLNLAQIVDLRDAHKRWMYDIVV